MSKLQRIYSIRYASNAEAVAVQRINASTEILDECEPDLYAGILYYILRPLYALGFDQVEDLHAYLDFVTYQQGCSQQRRETFEEFIGKNKSSVKTVFLLLDWLLKADSDGPVVEATRQQIEIKVKSLFRNISAETRKEMVDFILDE